MAIVEVDLGARSYRIVIERGLLPRAADEILQAVPRPSSAVVLTHPLLARLYAGPLTAGLAARGVRATVITVAPGERSKCLPTAARLYSRLVGARADRRSLLVALGGGVIGDLGGFVAATYLRGIPFVQAPTTLLSQVDASVGGKTGVDLPEGKNLVGAFNQPRAVLIDLDTSRSLPARELRSGLAEVVKHGIIRDDAYLCTVGADMPALLRRDPDALSRAVARSCEIKAGVVSEDEMEHGLRAILNFGHTVGHALEAVTGYRRYKHGEAVAVGMVAAALIGEEAGTTPGAVTARIRDVLRSAGLPTSFPPDVAPGAVIQTMAHDKKAVGGSMTFVLVPSIGHTVLRSDVPAEAVERALRRQQTL